VGPAGNGASRKCPETFSTRSPAGCAMKERKEPEDFRPYFPWVSSASLVQIGKVRQGRDAETVTMSVEDVQ
jgi:hypothetical protein